MLWVARGQLAEAGEISSRKRGHLLRMGVPIADQTPTLPVSDGDFISAALWIDRQLEKAGAIGRMWRRRPNQCQTVWGLGVNEQQATTFFLKDALAMLIENRRCRWRDDEVHAQCGPTPGPLLKHHWWPANLGRIQKR